MPDLLADREALRLRREALLAPGAGAETGAEGAQALAECLFRLALHPATPAEEGAAHLRRAMRIDGGHPRYAYHLARLHFLRGDLDGAGDLLLRAQRLSTHSHRVWAHLSLLQRELNGRYRGDLRYEQDALRARGLRLAEAVREGRDEVDDASLLALAPEESAARLEEARRRSAAPTAAAAPVLPGPPRRVRVAAPRPARARDGGDGCRWSGIHDLLAEAWLEAQGTAANRDRVQPLLARVAELAPARRGGSAAFVVLAVQWLLRGYAPATVRALASAASPDGSPSAALLREVLEAVEADAAELAERLARAVRAGALPPLTAALLHQRRLLAHPLTFRTLVREAAEARRVLGAGRARGGAGEAAPVADDEAERLARTLREAFRELEAAPAPTVPAKEAASEPESAAAEDPREALARLAGEAAALQGALRDAWGRLRAVRPGTAALEPAERADAAAAAELVAHADRLAAEGTAAVTAIRDAGARGAASEGAGEALSYGVEETQKALQDLGVQTGRLRRLLAKLPAVEGPAPVDAAASPPPAAAEAVTEGGQPPPAPEAPASGAALLARTLQEADGRVDALFSGALDTFAPYAAAGCDPPPLRALRLSVRARRAEALYRLGRRDEAQREWAGILRDDPLNLGAAKNVAVCDTGGPDRGRELASWRAYAEVLYLQDVVLDGPHHHARARAELHREIGHAYAPAFLARARAGGPFPDADPLELADFLNTPRRVRVFVSHVLLEFLDRALAFTSPSLVLGVPRDADGGTLAAARARTLRFVRRAAPLLPARVRGPFGALALRRVDEAARACASTRALTRRSDPAYGEGKAELQRLVDDGVRLQVALVHALRGTEGLAGFLRSGEFAGELLRLLWLPLSRSPDLLSAAVTRSGLSSEHVWHREFRRHVVHFAVGALREAGHTGAATRALVAALPWDPGVETVDMAMACFAEEAREAKRVDGHEALVRAVDDWADAARRRLARSRTEGEHEARDGAGEDGGPAEVPAAEGVRPDASGSAGGKGQAAGGVAEEDGMAEDDGPDEEPPEGEPLTAEDVDALRARLGDMLVDAFLAAAGIDPGKVMEEAHERVTVALDPLIAACPENALARWIRCNHLVGMAVESRDAGRQRRFISLLTRAREDAEVVERGAREPGLRAQARELISQIRDAVASAHVPATRPLPRTQPARAGAGPAVAPLPPRDEIFRDPLPLPEGTAYDELGIGPQAADWEIGPAATRRARELEAARSRVEQELRAVHDSVPGLVDALDAVERMERDPVEEVDPERLAEARGRLRELERAACAVAPDYFARGERVRELAGRLNTLNALALDQRETRLAYDRAHPPLALLKLSEPEGAGLPDFRTAQFLLRQEIAGHLAARGEAVFHPSDLTRTDFSFDFEPDPFLDGERGAP